MAQRVLLRLALALAAVVAGARGQPSDELALFKLPEPAPLPGGRCCDGSPAAWYYGPPANETVGDWVIWLEGGGGCHTAQKCKHRNVSTPTLMGSGNLKPTHATGNKNHGKRATPSKWIMSDDAQGNPDFFHAHHVYIPYCSSDEFAGTSPTTSAKTFGFYFSGHLNLVNIFGQLKKQHPKFGSASRVLFAGSSAGGAGVIHNIDWARTFFPPETVVKGAPLGGWFYPGDAPDQPNKWDPPSMWPDWSVGRVTPWEAAQKAAPPPFEPYVNPACAEAYGPNASDCISAHAVYPFIKTPMYVMENNYDLNQLQAQLGFQAANHSELAQEYVRYFGRAMRNSTAMVRQKPADGLFLSSCYDHTAGLGVGSDFHTTINGKQSGALLGEWFYDRLPAADRLVADDCGELPCNPTCDTWPGPAPGPGPPASGCVAQLVKDGCDPKEGAEKCGACAGSHQSDLRKAGCTNAFVEDYCEGKAPPGPPSPPSPPTGGCKAALDSLCPVAADPTPEECSKCAEAHVLKLGAAGCDMEDIKQLCLARKKPAGAL